MCVFNMYKMLHGGEIPQPDLTDVYPELLQIKKGEVKPDTREVLKPY